MLRGRFGNTSGRPYLEGRFIIPRLNIQSDISFLVDTGADSTVLLVDDARRIGIDYKKLKLSNRQSVGISGTTRHFKERAFVTFSEPGRFLYVYEIDLAITRPNPKLKKVPSLLGRNVIDNWRMTYNPEKEKLWFKVWHADYTIPVAKS